MKDNGQVKRISPKLTEAIERFRVEMARRGQRIPSFHQASGIYADYSFTPYEKVSDAMRKMGRARI
jgi:hypothetical protein